MIVSHQLGREIVIRMLSLDNVGELSMMTGTMLPHCPECAGTCRPHTPIATLTTRALVTVALCAKLACVVSVWLPVLTVLRRAGPAFLGRRPGRGVGAVPESPHAASGQG